MAQLMLSNQQKYVPTLKTIEETIILKPIPLHGFNFLKKEPGTSSGFTRMETVNLTGLKVSTQNFTDWQAKLNLYMVCILTLFDQGLVVIK